MHRHGTIRSKVWNLQACSDRTYGRGQYGYSRNRGQKIGGTSADIFHCQTMSDSASNAKILVVIMVYVTVFMAFFMGLR